MAAIRLLRGLLVAACLPSLARASCGIPRACSSPGEGYFSNAWGALALVNHVTCVTWAANGGVGTTYFSQDDGSCYATDCNPGYDSSLPGIQSGFPFMCKRLSTCTKPFPPKLLGKCPPGSQPQTKGAMVACCCSSFPFPIVDSKLKFQGCLTFHAFLG